MNRGALTLTFSFSEIKKTHRRREEEERGRGRESILFLWKSRLEEEGEAREEVWHQRQKVEQSQRHARSRLMRHGRGEKDDIRRHHTSAIKPPLGEREGKEERRGREEGCGGRKQGQEEKKGEYDGSDELRERER